jgi:hypothetical protein
VLPPRLQKSLFSVLSWSWGYARACWGGRGGPTGEYATGLKSALFLAEHHAPAGMAARIVRP